MRAAALLLLALTLMPPIAAMAAEDPLAPCAGCHGANGRSDSAGVPSLGGMPADYVTTQLYQFREKQRAAPPMNEIAAGFSDDDLRTLSEAIAALPPPTATESGDPARIARAQDVAAKHKCGSCHNADYSGHDQIPRLRAQREEYLAAALQGYRSNARPGYDPAMNEVAQTLSDADINDLAYFLARQ